MNDQQIATIQEAANYGCLILQGQEQPFLTMEANMRQAYLPESGYQTDLFHEALQAKWTVRRCTLAELHLHQSQTDPTQDPLMDDKNEKPYLRIARMKRDAERTYEKAIKQLAAIQTEIRFRLQTFPPEVKELGRDQAPHNFLMLVDTNRVLAGALKTNLSTAVETIVNPVYKTAEDLLQSMAAKRTEDSNSADTAAAA